MSKDSKAMQQPVFQCLNGKMPVKNMEKLLQLTYQNPYLCHPKK
jgi:hypothetical protein